MDIYIDRACLKRYKQQLMIIYISIYLPIYTYTHMHGHKIHICAWKLHLGKWTTPQTGYIAPVDALLVTHSFCPGVFKKFGHLLKSPFILTVTWRLGSAVSWRQWALFLLLRHKQHHHRWPTTLDIRWPLCLLCWCGGTHHQGMRCLSNASLFKLTGCRELHSNSNSYALM